MLASELLVEFVSSVQTVSLEMLTRLKGRPIPWRFNKILRCSRKKVLTFPNKNSLLKSLSLSLFYILYSPFTSNSRPFMFSLFVVSNQHHHSLPPPPPPPDAYPLTINPRPLLILTVFTNSSPSDSVRPVRPWLESRPVTSGLNTWAEGADLKALRPPRR